MVRVFDTNAYEPHERRAAFIGAFSTTEVPMQVSFMSDKPLYAVMDFWDLAPGIHLLRTRDTELRLTRTSRHLRISAPERIAIAGKSGGPAGLTVGSHQQNLRSGDLNITDQTLPSDYLDSGGGSQAFIMDYDTLGLPVDVGRRAMTSLPSSPLYDLFRSHLFQTCALLDTSPVDAASRALLASATLDLARAFIVTATANEALARAALDDTKMVRVNAYISQHLRDPDLNPRSIARANHMSLRQLYKLWNDNDVTLAEHIIRRRLQGAREDLARSSMRALSIGEIAATWGFIDATHFARRFRAAYQMTPGEWRHQNQ